MNRQELFNIEPRFDAANLPFIKLKGLSDFNVPRFSSGWPYFILVLSAILMVSTKLSSQNFPAEESRWASIRTTSNQEKGETHDYNYRFDFK